MVCISTSERFCKYIDTQDIVILDISKESSFSTRIVESHSEPHHSMIKSMNFMTRIHESKP